MCYYAQTTLYTVKGMQNEECIRETANPQTRKHKRVFGSTNRRKIARLVAIQAAQAMRPAKNIWLALP